MARLSVEYYRASGNGGQHRNKVETACRLVYGDITVTSASQRSRKQNYKAALAELRRRFSERQNKAAATSLNNTRRKQIGSGMRGDKIRTYRYQDNVVIDHRTNRKFKLSNVLKGKWR